MVHEIDVPPSVTGHPAYQRWMQEQDIPIYGGHFIPSPKTTDLGWWAARNCNAAFIQLEGQQGVSEGRITEIPPGGELPPLKMAVSEVIYVLEGQGLTTVWAGDGAKKTFEWGPHALFCLPRHCWHQHFNARGDQPVRILSYNYLPLAMSAISEPDLLLNNPYEAPEALYGKDGEDFYQDARMISTPPPPGETRGHQVYWRANFIPDLNAWDKLEPHYGRGGGGHVVYIRFHGADMSCHMSVFDPQLYKKAHKHGPGRIIVIPKGEGYSILWPGNPFDGEILGAEKAVCHWSEGTLFVPPQNWYHQHFNAGGEEGRYLALGPTPQFSGNNYRHQIEYPYEDPWVREMFEGELAKRGLKSLMPPQCYEDPDFEFGYGDDS